MKLHSPSKINPLLFILLLWLFSLNSNAVVFEAENYDSFFDLSPGNSGGEFRQDDVDIESTVDEDGGFNVGWIEADEWLLFHQLVIPATGSYQINLRVASLDGASVAVDLNSGTIPLGQFTIPATGDWQTWTTVSRTVDINEGTYDLGVFAVSGGWNINFIEVISLTPQGSSSASSQPAEPDKSLETNQSIRFEAENYVAFFDTSPGNEGRALRTDDVDIEFAADEAGAFNVGWIDVNEWLEFRPFIVPVTGNYDIHLRVASIPGGIVTLDLNAGAIPLDDFSIPVTDGW
ncbi:MAG: lam16E, partial [Cellvibrio sp.]|nr:lam16E [Cellvibrio sp.]